MLEPGEGCFWGAAGAGFGNSSNGKVNPGHDNTALTQPAAVQVQVLLLTRPHKSPV